MLDGRWWTGISIHPPSQHLDDFVACYSAGNISARQETERFKKYAVSDLLTRDKTSLDITWIKEQTHDTDCTLGELLSTIKEKSDNISNAVAQLQQLLAGIEE